VDVWSQGPVKRSGSGQVWSGLGNGMEVVDSGAFLLLDPSCPGQSLASHTCASPIT
jgi:hypothetical protein